MIRKPVNYTYIQLLLFFLSGMILTASFYLQYIENLKPCPLCIMQRVCVVVLLLISLINICYASFNARRILLFLQIIVSACGVFFVARQLWLQFLPYNHTHACMPEFATLLRYFPWKTIVNTLVWGGGNCAENNWQWLGLSIPTWSGFYFIFMLLSACMMLWSLKRLS